MKHDGLLHGGLLAGEGEPTLLLELHRQFGPLLVVQLLDLGEGLGQALTGGPVESLS